MRRLATTLIVGLLAFSPTLLAQRTWIVDRSNGLGTDFTDLQPALDAASHGDTIVVRFGVYYTAVTNRGVTLLGESSSLPPTIASGLIGTSGIYRAVLVEGLPAGRTFVMRGFGVSGYGVDQHAIEVRDCAGHVVIANCHVTGATGLAHGLRISDSADVSVLNSGLPSGLSLSDSRIWLRDTFVRGAPAQSQLGTVTSYAQPACLGLRAEISVCGGSLVGGPGMSGLAPDEPAMRINDCQTRLATGSGLFLRTGTNAGTQIAVIVANGGTLDIDPTIPLSVNGTATVTRRRVPAMHAAPVPIGSVLSLDLYAVPADAFQMFLGLRADPLALGELGTLWLEPAAFFLVGSGTLDSFGSTSRGLLVPNDPYFQGVVLGAQALRYGTSGTSLTDPATVLIY